MKLLYSSNNTRHTTLFQPEFQDYASWGLVVAIPTKLLNSDADARIAQALVHTVSYPL